MDLKEVCRTCLRIPKNSVSLFEDGSVLIKRIQAISSVQIKENNELSSVICEDCQENINRFYSFQKVIKNTDYDLHYRLETLKKTNYCSKPRSAQPMEPETNLIELRTDFKSEEVEPDIEIDTEPDNFIPDLSYSLKKALAVRKLFKCRQCNELFPTKSTLFHHKRRKHVATGICNICGLKTRADNLKKHIKLHSEGPCKCEQCGRMLKNSESLRTHRLLHLEGSYTCEICGKTFKLKNEHTRHLKRHQNPDYSKMTCPLCGKKVHDRRKHMLTHTGERPYNCAYCQKDFSTSFALKVHTRQHTNERPYACTYCNCSFTQKVSLMTHLKSKHR